MSSDSIIIIGVQCVVAIGLYIVNSKWYYTERVKQIMSWIFLVTLILSVLSAYGKTRIVSNVNFLDIVIGNLIFLQILVQLISLIIKGVFGLYSSYASMKEGEKSKIYRILKTNAVVPAYRRTVTIGVLSTGVICWLFWIMSNNSLTECELNFIEGSGISKKAYRRIQDEIRVLTIDEIQQIASAIPEGSFEYNLRNTAIKSTFYKDCLKNIKPNKAETTYLIEVLSDLRVKQIASDSTNLFHIKRYEEISLSSSGRKVQRLKDLVITSEEYNYDWDIVMTKFPEFQRIDLQLLKNYTATAKKLQFNYDQINLEFPELFDFDMNERVLSFSYELFQRTGYNGDYNQFKTLMVENKYARVDVHQLLYEEFNLSFLSNEYEERKDSIELPMIWNERISELPFKEDHIFSIIESEKLYPRAS